MSSSEPEKVSRRGFINVAVGVIVAGVIAGVGGWFVGSTAAPPPKTVTVTETAAAVTVTKTAPPVTTTVTAPPKTITTTATVTKTVTATPVAPKIITVGATVSKSGPWSGDVEPFDRMMHAFAELVNERGGVYVKEYGQRLPIKFVIYDDKSDVATAAKLYERLITVDKVDFLIGPYTSASSLAVGPIVEKYEIPVIWTEAQSPKVFQQGWKYAHGVLDPSPKSWGGAYFTYIVKPLVEKGELKTIALIHEDIVHSWFVNKGAKSFAEELGLEIVLEEKFPVKGTDFTGLMPKIRTANPDLLHFAACTAASSAAFIKQAKEFDLRPKEFHVTEPVMGAIEPAGKDADYITGESYYAPGAYQGPCGDEKFLAELAKRADFDPVKWVWFGIHYPALQAMVATFEMAESLDPEDLIDAINKMKIMTVSGPLYFREDGSGSLRCVTVQVFNLSYRLIAPPAVATHKHVFPFVPWGQR